MPCYHPITAYKSRETHESGKRKFVFYEDHKMRDMHLAPVELPCGQCIGCKLERSRQWAIRCVHEASQQENNVYITLTYNDEHLPRVDPGDNETIPTLCPRDFQLFMKRLRKQNGANIRFFHCGEYGPLKGRPHYHAIIFNLDFEKDKKPWKMINGNQLYTSKALNDLWSQDGSSLGFSSLGAVTFHSAAYVARYLMKKLTGPQAEAYEWNHPKTGQLFRRHPEYTTMSRRPGIGKTWLNQYQDDIYPGDFVIINQKKMKPPKYYDRQFEITDPKDYNQIKRQRVREARKHGKDTTPERLAIREKVKIEQLKRLPRNLD